MFELRKICKKFKKDAKINGQDKGLKPVGLATWIAKEYFSL